ncbi:MULTISPECIES: hypothetical protein [Bacillus]|uniref:hypothetical protein n=1 Tax=Bacillus TaxID=1386 RepID=UPI001BB3BCB9|nr:MULTISPECIES: hypothetical protein [Bacillus]BCC80205.1 hypothetical protein BCJMU62_p214 [Bacillus cereus]GMB79170.1 hypothetical protein BCER1_55710 [Bacillus cereus]
MEKKRFVFLLIAMFLGAQLLIFGCYLALKKDSNETGIKVSDTSKEFESGITQRDVDQVEKQTTEWLEMFKVGTVLKEENLVELNHRYMNKVFVENEYPNKQVQQQWLGYSGMGQFFDKELVQGNGMSIVINAVHGKIEAFEIENTDKDNVNETITTYAKVKLKNSQTVEKHWIEWNKQPNENWKVGSVSFNGGIEMLERPLSPKRG